MSWIVLEGLDRTGKSTVSEIYKKRGYKVIHMSAPAKKYTQPGYAGPSYLDDLLEQLMELDGQDVIFDRSWYGEQVWSYVYGREPLLSEEDLEVLQEYEDRNSTERVLMIDPDAKAHWDRCVANNEPLTLSQFKTASMLFNKVAHKYNFVPRQLKDYDKTEANKPASPVSKQEEPVKARQSETTITIASPATSATVEFVSPQENELDKLEKANAIRDVLSKRILKQKGGAFDKLEEDMKGFLMGKLSDIFSEPSKVSLSEEEVTILKLYCKQLKEKVGKK